MSFSNDKTPELWGSFMPRRKEIKNNLNTDLFCMQMYHEAFNGKYFNPDIQFEKWAAVEVTNFDVVPEGMETYTLTGGLYAVLYIKALQVREPKLLVIFLKPGCLLRNIF